MRKNKNPLSLFITDNGAALFGGKLKKDTGSTVYGQISFPKNIIDNGYIKEPEILLNKLKEMWKEYDIKPKFIRLVIQDQNVLVREFEVSKSDLEKSSIDDYLYNQIGKSFHVPFAKPIISYQIADENPFRYIFTLYIADENLLNDYYDVIECLGVKDVIFDLAISALMELVTDEIKLKDENALIVSLYDRLFSLQIIEKNRLIFGVIEECDGKQESFLEMVSNYIERIANYYQYNLRKGKDKITKTIVFNLNDYLDSLEVKTKIFDDLKYLNIKLFHSDIIDGIFENLPKGSLVAYGSNVFLQRRLKDKKIIDFKLHRINKLRLLGYYIFVLAVTIFASISLIYIPFHQQRENILDKTYDIEAKTYQLNLLNNYINQQSENNTFNIYIDTFEEILLQQESIPLDYFSNLLEVLPETLVITDYGFDVLNKQISLVLSGQDTISIINFILDIYERFGISISSIDNQWIDGFPEYNFITSSVCEVIINYA